ncbi:hypothetical protein DPMN_041414 [Dreissena polymorpha]|uniref:Uncharacterized protein n=1 Tax=Dreissena polymorpha TaxID=45954 RepID=A0A9D4CYL4_DREPO|nr:hypothetical protein DPMN_041414 [Dreissena polymorpha]
MIFIRFLKDGITVPTEEQVQHFTDKVCFCYHRSSLGCNNLNVLVNKYKDKLTLGISIINLFPTHFQLYRPFVQQLMSNIEERFPDLPLLQLFEAFNTTKFPTGDMGNHGEQDIKVMH